MRNTKGVLPVTGIVPPITKTMHRSFTDSIVSVTRNLFSDEVEVILSVSRFCNKRAGFPIKIFGETLRFSVNLVTLLPGSLWTLVGLRLVGCKIDSHDNLICTYINYVTYRAVFFLGFLWTMVESVRFPVRLHDIRPILPLKNVKFRLNGRYFWIKEL